MKETKSVQLFVRLKPSEKAAILEAAARDQRSGSDWARLRLLEVLAKKRRRK